MKSITAFEGDLAGLDAAAAPSRTAARIPRPGTAGPVPGRLGRNRNPRGRGVTGCSCSCWGCRTRRATAAAVREVLRDEGISPAEADRLAETCGACGGGLSDRRKRIDGGRRGGAAGARDDPLTVLVDTSTSPYRWTVPAGILGDPLVEGTVARRGGAWFACCDRREVEAGDPGAAIRAAFGATDPVRLQPARVAGLPNRSGHARRPFRFGSSRS